MIEETQTRKLRSAITSDHWHVVHARWTEATARPPMFDRTIVSEHDDRDSARDAGKALTRRLESEMDGRPESRRDQVFVRRPGFRSMKLAPRRRPKGH